MVRVWNADTGRPLTAFKGGADGINDVAFGADGRQVATAGADMTVRLWEADTGRELRVFRGHTAAVQGVAFSPDGCRLASAGWDSTVRVWDLTTGRELLTMKGHRSAVTCVLYSPDGQRLASGGEDSTVRIWDAATGRELLTLKAHPNRVNTLAFSPDGRRLASGGQDPTIRIWETMPLAPEVWRRRALVSHLADLFNRLVLRDDVLAALHKEGTLSETDRQFLVRLAQRHTDDAEHVNGAAWSIVVSRDAGKDAYALALRRAEAAVALAPGDGLILNTLGVAQYRVGRYADALATLTKSDKLNSAATGRSLPADLAFLAMAHHQLAKKNEARATLARLREPGRAMDAESQGFLREAEELIEGKPGGKRP